MSRNVRTQKAADDWNSKMLQQIAVVLMDGSKKWPRQLSADPYNTDDAAENFSQKKS